MNTSRVASLQIHVGWVAIGFYGTKTLELINRTSDKMEQILLLEVKLVDTANVLVNIYNSNTETETLQTLSDLDNNLEKKQNIQNKNIILGGDLMLLLIQILKHFERIEY